MALSTSWAPSSTTHAGTCPQGGPFKAVPRKTLHFPGPGTSAKHPNTPTSLSDPTIVSLCRGCSAASHTASASPKHPQGLAATPALWDHDSRRPLRPHGACASPRADLHIVPEYGHHIAESRPPWVQSRSWKTRVCPHSWKSRNISANMVISANSCQNPKPPVKSEGAEPQKVKPATPQPLHSQLRTCCEDPMPVLTVCMENRREVRRVTVRYDSSFVTPTASLFHACQRQQQLRTNHTAQTWIHTALLGLRCRPRAGPAGPQGPGNHAAAQAGPPNPSSLQCPHSSRKQP